jgi:hypothetical protein
LSEDPEGELAKIQQQLLDSISQATMLIQD